MTQREEKERLRAERLAAEASQAGSERRRLMLGYVAAGLLTAAVLAGIIVAVTSGGGGGGSGGGDTPANAHIQLESGTASADISPDSREGTPPPAIKVGDLKVAAKEAGCVLMLDLKDEGSEHSTGEEGLPKYGTNPPTSGNHFGSNEVAAGAAADGAYRERPPIGRVVHSMEHSRIEIQYDPKLPEDQQLALKGVFDEDPAGMLLFSNPDMPYAVAVTAWTQLVGCPTYSPTVLDVIRDFRDTYRGKGPESVPLSF